MAAARRLQSARTVFIGVGRPSTAAILARAVHNPELVIYESGAIGAKPARVPLSIGDGELAETADVVVSVPEMFNLWIAPGRIDVAFLGAAQIDPRANLNASRPIYGSPSLLHQTSSRRWWRGERGLSVRTTETSRAWPCCSPGCPRT